MVRISLFGTLSLSDPLRPATPIGGRCAGLLAYIALHRGRTVARAELLEQVWADRADRLNASTFNTALWRLRQRLEPFATDAGELVLCDATGGVRLNPAATTWLDVDEFETHARAAHPNDAHDVAALEAAIGLYRADLLLDHHDDWVLRERERLRRVYLDCLARLLACASARGAHDEAIAHGQAILALEPLREDVHCALMRAYVAAGRRALALRQFERCRASLRIELAVSPMQDTIALYRRIAEQGDAPAYPAGGSVVRLDAPGIDRRDPVRSDRRSVHEPRATYETTTRAASDAIPLPVAEVMPTGAMPMRIRREFATARRHLRDADAHLRNALELMPRRPG